MDQQDFLTSLPQSKDIDYRCSSCGRTVGKFNLKVKRAQFREMGTSAPIVRSRVIAWLCVIPQEDGSASCLEKDPDWNQPLYKGSPGVKNNMLTQPEAV